MRSENRKIRFSLWSSQIPPFCSYYDTKGHLRSSNDVLDQKIPESIGLGARTGAFWPELARNQGFSRNLATRSLEKDEIIVRFISNGARSVDKQVSIHIFS